MLEKTTKIVNKIMILVSLVFVMMPGFISYASSSNEIEDTQSNITVSTFDNSNGLPTSEANVVYQTTDGYIWIGSYSGLLRYDGSEFVNMAQLDVGLPSTGIRSLYEDKDGILWIGTNDEGMYVYSKGVFNEVFDETGNSLPSVRAIVQDKDGCVYVGTSSGVYRLFENAFVKLDIEQLFANTIYYLSVDENNVIWGTDSASNTFAISDDGLVDYLDYGIFSANDSYSVFASGKNIYVGTSGSKIRKITLKDSNYNEQSYSLQIISTGSLYTINSVLLASDGKLWIGASNGTGWMDSDYKVHVNDEIVKCTSIVSICEDYEGDIWMSSNKSGVFLLRNGKFSHVASENSMMNDSVNAIAIYEKKIYVATDTGLCVCDLNWNELDSDFARQFDGVRVRDVMVDSQGKLWVGTYSETGLCVYDLKSKKTQYYNGETGLSSSWVRKVYELSNGDMAVLSSGGVDIISKGKVITNYNASAGLTTTMSLCGVELPDGRLLVGSDGGGIFLLENGEATHLSGEGFDDIGVVLRMTYDVYNNGIWVSSGNDFYFVDELLNIKKLESLKFGVGSIFDVIVLKDFLLVIKSDGLYIINREEIDKDDVKNVSAYGQDDGMIGNLNANAWNYYDAGIAYLCSSKGVSCIRFNGSKSSKVAPKMIINEIVISDGKDDVVVSYDDIKSGNIKVPSDTKRLTIKFADLVFSDSNTTVQYKLSGFDSQENIAGDINTATYTNLSGGEYVFYLSAFRSDGTVCEDPIRIVFVKELSFLERPSVRALIVISFALFIFLIALVIYKLRLKKVKKEQERYKEITNQSLLTIANTVDAKDKYTNGHSRRVAEYSRDIAKVLGMNEREQEEVYYSALLHDIGKIGIPDAILNKPGRLSDAEFEIMKTHTTMGYKILEKFKIMPNIGDGARWHHEKIDGTGYPDGLLDEEIPYVAKIICVADSYDAMSTDRTYRTARTREYIIAEFNRCSGTQFDPEIVEAFLKMIENTPE